MTDNNIIIGVCRYNNTNGTSCYMNSILHIMQQLIIFTDYLIIGKFLNNNNDSIIYELYKLFKLSCNNDDKIIDPRSFKSAINKKNDMWAQNEQQDAQEFYIFIITKLEEELGKKIKFIPNKNGYDEENVEIFKKSIEDNNSNKIFYNFIGPEIIYNLFGLKMYQENMKNNYSIIKELFIGSTSSNLICQFCKTISPNFEDFITLSIDIPNVISVSLMDCLQYSLKDEILDKNNKSYCGFCGLKNQSTKQIKLWKTPKILVIHFKRFKFNDYGIQTSKNTTQIIYPLNLNIKKICNPYSPYKNKSNYNLIGINIHQELRYKSLECGHYVSFVKNNHNNKWYLFNDSSPLVKLSKKDLPNKNAYMLFYLREN